MHSSLSRGIVAASLVVAALLTTQNVAQAQDDLNALFDKARGSFKPVSEKELAAARANVDAAMKDVERFVRPTSENGKRWLRYLRWDDLKGGLDAKSPENFRAIAT